MIVFWSTAKLHKYNTTCLKWRNWWTNPELRHCAFMAFLSSWCVCVDSFMPSYLAGIHTACESSAKHVFSDMVAKNFRFPASVMRNQPHSRFLQTRVTFCLCQIKHKQLVIQRSGTWWCDAADDSAKWTDWHRLTQKKIKILNVMLAMLASTVKYHVTLGLTNIPHQVLTD